MVHHFSFPCWEASRKQILTNFLGKNKTTLIFVIGLSEALCVNVAQDPYERNKKACSHVPSFTLDGKSSSI
jgi:hypothetical protein